MAKKAELRIEAPTPGNQLFFISDTHFFHKAILRPDYSGRPFKDVEDMNESMVELWNATVAPTDRVFHLGDFAMAGPRSTINLIRRLNGRKHLVHGNHDLKIRGIPEAEALFERVIDFGCQIKVEDPEAFQGAQRITLCHYAFRIWNKSHYGAWSLYGHSHGNLPEPDNMLSMDVGVDATARRVIEPQASRWTWGERRMPETTRGAYRPISYAEVKTILSQRSFKAIDHHRQEDPGE